MEIIVNGVNGYMDDNLETAVKCALICDREAVYDSSKYYTWEKCTESFVTNLRQIN